MPDARTTVLTDAVANWGGAVLTAASPQLWAALGLPENVRRPVAAALLASAVFHTASTAAHEPSSTQLRLGAGINAGWVAAGLATQVLPLGAWQRTALLSIVSYDAMMTTLKTRLSRG